MNIGSLSGRNANSFTVLASYQDSSRIILLISVPSLQSCISDHNSFASWWQWLCFGKEKSYTREVKLNYRWNPLFINKNKFIPHTVYPDYSFSSFLLLPIIFPKPLVEENRLIKNKFKYNKIQYNKIMQKLTHQYWKEKLNR